MPRPRRDSPLADESLRELIAPALFAEIATCPCGSWSECELEQTVLKSSVPAHQQKGRSHPALASEQFECTHLFEQMLGSRVPTDGVLNELSEVFPGARLISFKYHPLWDVLMPGELGCRAAMRVVQDMPEAHRDLMFRVISGQKLSKDHCSSDPYESLFQLGCVEALVFLTATLRYEQESDCRNVRNVTATLRAAFPRIVSFAPQLYCRWRHLAKQLQKIGKTRCFMSDELGDWGRLEKDIALAARQAQTEAVKLPIQSIVTIPASWNVIIPCSDAALQRVALAAGLLHPDESILEPAGHSRSADRDLFDDKGEIN